jgi:hypothetical protein
MAEKVIRLDISLALQLRASHAQRFEAAATKRGIDPAFLLADLLETICEDDMFDAILDDAEALP